MIQTPTYVLGGKFNFEHKFFKYRFGPLKPALLSALSSGGMYPIDNNGGYSGVNSPQETEKLTTGGNDYQKLSHALSTKANSDESVTIEYGKRFMPPLWVDIQEDIESHLDEIATKSNPPPSFLPIFTPVFRVFYPIYPI